MDQLSRELFANRRVEFAYEIGRKEIVEQVEMDLFGRHFSDSDYADMVAALNGAEIVVDYNDKEKVIVVSASHPFYEILYRTIGVVNGKRTIDNVLFGVARPPAPKGVGARITARQVEMARRLGFDQITLYAAGRPKDAFNGYYVWPRFGYNMDVSDMRAELEAAGFSGVDDTNTLMMRTGGNLWWQENGKAGHCVFDLSRHSLSSFVHDNYMKENGIVAVE